MKKFKFPETIKKLANVFHENSFELFVVGGAVRDYFAGNVVKDYDFATNALPEQVVSLFAHTIPTGIEHGTVTVVLKGNSYEVTTYRSEGTYKNSRHPEEVHFIGNITEDLKRRDFTINALAVNTSTGELLDYHKGLLDLQNKVIRAIGNPSQRFREDSLRMLRAFRFSAVLGFTIEKETLDAIQFCSSEIIHISSERIKEELNKILSAEYPSNTLSSMNSIGILTNVLPELSECESIGEKGSNKIDTFRHLCLSCDGAPNSNLIVRWAALLHDIGKPSAEIININGTTAYHGHDRISGDLADSVLRRLKFSNVFRKEVVHLI
ncbi:MAG: HD domain-containing protein, partial [Spirochaetaceae bacterium]|nr:HD domain-containing protein [Spirochaetaceae bacterium]